MNTGNRQADRHAQDILYGFHPVAEALAAGRREIREILIAKSSVRGRFQRILEKAALLDIPIREVAEKELSALAGTGRHQGIGASAARFPLVGLQELTTVGRPASLLMLDGVVDPQNLGALLRAADGAGVHGVVLPRDRSASPTPAVSKASAGAMEHLRIAAVTNLVQAVGELKKHGFWIYGLDGGADRSLFETKFDGDIVLVVGGEEKGLRPLVRRHCDVLVSIPQRGAVASLNASVAGAVAMYERCRQQLSGPPETTRSGSKEPGRR